MASDVIDVAFADRRSGKGRGQGTGGSASQTLEELISEQEEYFLFLRRRETLFAKAEKQEVESRLKALREEQRQSSQARRAAAEPAVQRAFDAVQPVGAEVAVVQPGAGAAALILEEAEGEHLNP